MKMIPALIAAASCLVAGALWAQQIYRWVDANGRVHYTAEKPPPGVKSAPLATRISSYSGAAVVTQIAASGSAPAASAEVRMYSTDWCTYCRQARAYFGRNGIRYTELDIEKSAAARAEYDRLGARGVPVIVVGSRQMNGYSEEQLAAMLRAAGR